MKGRGRASKDTPEVSWRCNVQSEKSSVRGRCGDSMERRNYYEDFNDQVWPRGCTISWKLLKYIESNSNHRVATLSSLEMSAF